MATSPPASTEGPGTPARVATADRFARARRRIDALLPAAALVLAFAVLLPVVHAPFFGDDTINSELGGYLELTGNSAIETVVDATEQSLRSGRPQVLGWITGYPPWFTLGDHSVLYHLYLLALLALDGALLLALLRRLGWGTATAAFVIILGGAFMQLRLYHDSLLAYAGLMQVVFALVLASAIFFHRWLAHARRRDLWFAVALFLVCLLTYRVTYTFAAVHVALAFAHRRGRAAIRGPPLRSSPWPRRWSSPRGCCGG